MHRNGVSNAIAAGLLVAGVLIGATGFYVATTYQPKTATQTETATMRLTAMATVTAPPTATQTVLVTTTLATTVTPISGSPWKTAAEYPLQISDAIGVSAQQCVNSTAYVYCIGGQDVSGGPRNAAYTSSAISSSSGNITYWAPDSSLYPQSIFAQACVTHSGFVYCVGGTYDDAGDDVASSYYAPLSGDGVVGTWAATTAYPVPVDGQYCVASSGYIYCVGGWNEADGTNATSVVSNSVYYASLSSSGIGSWSPSTPYPANTYFPSCFAAGGYIYCLGGVDGNGNAVSADYYAPLSSSGVGTWTQTTAYPLQMVGQACAISSGYVYCVGGVTASDAYADLVYYASISSAGIGTWTQAAYYPVSTWTTCVTSSGNLYCVGGLDNSSAGENGATYYASLDSLSGVTTSD
jgi:hypothetical protein